MAVIRVLSVEGDESFEYEADVEDERLERARSLFDAKTRKGYLAFVPHAAERSGTHLRRFDPSAREIILQPPMAGG
jgi:hypothetical protein